MGANVALTGTAMSCDVEKYKDLRCYIYIGITQHNSQRNSEKGKKLVKHLAHS